LDMCPAQHGYVRAFSVAKLYLPVKF
jgi:hypothetical protein